MSALWSAKRGCRLHPRSPSRLSELRESGDLAAGLLKVSPDGPNPASSRDPLGCRDDAETRVRCWKRARVIVLRGLELPRTASRRGRPRPQFAPHDQWGLAGGNQGTWRQYLLQDWRHTDELVDAVLALGSSPATDAPFADLG